MSKQTEYWTAHFAQCAATGDRNMDSSEGLMISMYGLVLHLIGARALEGRILDVGCGTGLLSDSLSRLGAEVTGLDGEYVIEQNRYRDSLVEWVAADLESDWQVEPADVVLCLESLQFVDVPSVVARLWAHVRPGGRLLFTLPDLRNGINAEGNREHRGMFGGTRAGELNALVRNACAGYETWKAFGLHLNTDQRIDVYDTGRLCDLDAPAPYRLLAVVLKP